MNLFLCNPLRGNDGACGADEPAEVAADTLGADDARLACIGIEFDGLVTAIHTRDITAAAADTTFAVDLRIDDAIAVQISVATVLHPSQGGFVVIETDGTDGTRRIASHASLHAGCVLTDQAATCFFVDIQLSHDDLFVFLRIYIAKFPRMQRYKKIR